MSQYDNTNRGVLFDNERKQTDSHPDMTGTLNINGVDHWFSGWWKETRDGSEFLSLSIGKPKEAQQESRTPTQPQQSRGGNRPSQRQAPAPQRAASPAASGLGFDADDDTIPF